jgi:hypothetical protein
VAVAASGLVGPAGKGGVVRREGWRGGGERGTELELGFVSRARNDFSNILRVARRVSPSKLKLFRVCIL